MSWSKWQNEGKINIDASNPVVPYLSYLGSDCGPGLYAYKAQRKGDSRHEYRLLIKKLTQLGGSDLPHLILTVNLRKDPPIEMWHYKDSDGKYIGSIESQLIALALALMPR